MPDFGEDYMKRLLLAGMGLCLAFSAIAQTNSNDADIDALLRSMSIDEKVGQMVQVDISLFLITNSTPPKIDTNKLRAAFDTYHVGSILNPVYVMPPAEWQRVVKTIQEIALAGSPHKIPVLYGIDSIHGASFMKGSTLFPQHPAMGATRNPDLMREAARISAMETRAAGVRWTFAPVLDVGRQPLWPRFSETLGEDPYLVSAMGVAEIQGLQGTNLDSPTSVAACMKHFFRSEE